MSKTRTSATSIGAAEFKTRCLELMDRVRETRAEFVVTKHGRPVAKLVPYEASGRDAGFWGSLKGTVLRYERPFDPVDGAWFDEPASRTTLAGRRQAAGRKRTRT